MNKNKSIDKLFLIVVSFQTVLMGIVFIIQLLRIYFGNNKIFTREICVEYIVQILPVIILWILIILGSGIYYTIKNNPQKNIGKITNVYKLNLMKTYISDDDQTEEIELLKKENKKVLISKIVNIVILVICSFMGLCYLFNKEHFDSSGSLTEQAIQMGICLSPWVIISFISLIGASLYEEVSARKSIDLIKVILKTKKNERKKVLKDYQKEENIKLILRISVFVIAVVLIIVGALNGQADSVLEKAINICTECIGLG